MHFDFQRNYQNLSGVFFYQMARRLNNRNFLSQKRATSFPHPISLHPTFSFPYAKESEQKRKRGKVDQISHLSSGFRVPSLSLSLLYLRTIKFDIDITAQHRDIGRSSDTSRAPLLAGLRLPSSFHRAPVLYSLSFFLFLSNGKYLG